jgi:small subunit ribosomal protein S20
VLFLKRAPQNRSHFFRLCLHPNPLCSHDPVSRLEMANTKSAKKATRKIERRTAVNRARRSRMRTYVRKVEEALRTGDAAAATAAFADAQPALIRAAQLGVVHRNTASRKVSRLSKAIKAMTA